MNYSHDSNWEPIVACAWIAIPGDDYETQHERSGGMDAKGQDTFILNTNKITFRNSADEAIADAKTLKGEVLICKLGFSELTCINALQCAMHGDTMDFPVTVLERLVLQV